MKKPWRGYTMVEVMMALGVLAIGATGVVAMQKAALLGNANAKSIATASGIAERWAERLRVDAMVWNNGAPSDMPETRWLKIVTAAPAVWNLPPDVPGKASPFEDPLGADMISAADTGAVGYCTHLSFRQITPKLVSTVVRVTWRRDLSSIDCTAADLLAPDTDLGRYGAVYVTTGLVMQEHPE